MNNYILNRKDENDKQPFKVIKLIDKDLLFPIKRD